MRIPPVLSRLAVILVAALFAVPPSLAHAAGSAPDEEYYDDDLPSARVARVSFVDGDASLRQSGSDEWEEVGRNTPVFAGDEYFTSRRSRIEIQLGGGRYVRLGEHTDVVFAELSPNFVRLEVPTGTVVLSIQDLDADEWFEVSAPAAAVSIREKGIYRIDVNESGDTRVAVARGAAEVSGPNDSVDLRAGDTVRFGYDGADRYDLGSLGYRDDFDDWCYERDEYYAQYYSSSEPVSSILYRNDIYGLAELAAFGTWMNVSGYGYCWQPSVASGWSPYSSGYWNWYPGYGYTWVSYEPWGWAPYHSGRWIWDGRYGWVWVPWSSYCGGSYYWRPHQVYFYGYPGYNGYAWVPLAPNEPYVSYRNLSRRHRDNQRFRPVHLRNGRGVVVANRSDDGRLRPGRIDPGIKGREPVALVPVKPPRVTVVKPRFDPRPADNLRLKPVVVKERSVGDVKPRTETGNAVVGRRPVRVAAATTTKPGRETPRVRMDDDNVPTLVDADVPKPRKPKPDDDSTAPATRRSGNDSNVAPARRGRVDVPSKDDPDTAPVKPVDRPKPKAVKPVGPDPDANPDTVKRRNNSNESGDKSDRRREQRDDGDRGQPINVTPPREKTRDVAPPRREQPPSDSGSRNRNVERVNPPVKSSPPPPVRVDPPKVERKPPS